MHTQNSFSNANTKEWCHRRPLKLKLLLPMILLTARNCIDRCNTRFAEHRSVLGGLLTIRFRVNFFGHFYANICICSGNFLNFTVLEVGSWKYSHFLCHKLRERTNCMCLNRFMDMVRAACPRQRI